MTSFKLLKSVGFVSTTLNAFWGDSKSQRYIRKSSLEIKLSQFELMDILLIW
jgi:hypothetical protein